MKNFHLDHVEDLMFTRGELGLVDSITFLSAVTNQHPAFEIHVKWDGWPSVIAGYHPSNGRFFVGTKSVFSKTDPKINYTEWDIRNNYPTDYRLFCCLSESLNHLPKVINGGVYQGDLLFSRSELMITNDGFSFAPNLIEYRIPYHPVSHEVFRIAEAAIGVAFHTAYRGGPELHHMESRIGLLGSGLTNHLDVWQAETLLTHIAYDDRLLEIDHRIMQIRFRIPEAKLWIRAISQRPKYYWQNMLPFINQQVKAGRHLDDSVTVLDHYVNWLVQKRQRELKTFDHGKEAQLRNMFNADRAGWLMLLDIYHELVQAKNLILKNINRSNFLNISTVIADGDSYVSTNHEGYVVVSPTGQAAKLVNRDEFSRRLFLKEEG